MRTYRVLSFMAAAGLISVLTLFTNSATGSTGSASAQKDLVGIWSFPVAGYYISFDRAGRLCYGGSTQSVAEGRYCNHYTVENGIVTETCMGGPEARNCPLAGGTCKARVSINESGSLQYTFLRGQCDMLAYKLVPPMTYTFVQR